MNVEIEYVFELPTTVVYELCDSLDPKNFWEEVARVMPGISSIDIDGCRQTPRPTEALLRIWGSKGYKILDLFKVFGRAKYTMCMETLHPFIDSKFHSMTALCSKTEVSSPRPAHPNEVYSVGRSEHTQPSNVYSKKTHSQIDGTLFNDTELNNASGDIFAGLHNTPLVKYEDIRAATNNFADENVCGKGGYGVVYRGTWKHTEVAVKRIRTQNDKNGAQNKERIRQSLQELRHLSKLRHDNILSLYAFSMDGAEPCLIYQFMSNGSLEDRLLCRNNSQPLNWETRKSICQGASRGLNFLHSIGASPLIHGDVKCANILLDKHLEPKLGDFGLSRDGQVELGASEKLPMIASHIKGTLAYLPPEFTRNKIFTTKLDVYSFGVVLLEVATGLRAYSDSREPHSLVAYVNKIQNEVKGNDERLKEALSDKRLPLNKIDEKTFRLLLNQGLKCSLDDRKQRPSFSEIIVELTG
ncbi:Protein kinase domain-containing protein [Aphelenchoides bicaudatus]|nr:Protein kinase domain-containing protein [Aphelenchoides bicaudatus]